MPHCPHCARETTAGWTHCPDCGTSLAPRTDPADRTDYVSVSGTTTDGPAATRRSHTPLLVGGAALAIVLLLVAVGTGTYLALRPAPVTVAAATATTAPTSSAAPARVPVTTPAPTTPRTTDTRGASAATGVTTIADIFGPGCSALPTEGTGSAAGMVDAPVGTAASNNPLLTTLASAVSAAGLVETLNSSSAGYTLFAPDNDAWAALPTGTLNALLADPSGQLTTLLVYHVVPQRFDAASLVAAGSVSTVQGSDVTIGGTPESPTVNGNPVVCGNIPTANATVFILGSVLVPAT